MARLGELDDRLRERMVSLMISAFGMVSALAWNEAVKSLVTEIFGRPDNLEAMFVYAVAVTALAVAVTSLAGKGKQG